MSFSYDDLINKSNPNIYTFIVMKKTQCVRQISDTLFEKTKDFVIEQEVYEGEVICARNNNLYISLGYDSLLEYEVFIPVICDDNQINIMKLFKDVFNTFN
jgi:hypothetical protein